MGNILVWGAMFIPVLIAIFLLMYFQQKMKWWELVAPFVVTPLLVCGLGAGFGWIQSSDTEYWTGWVTKATYLEAWTETTYEDVKDSKGNVVGQRAVVTHHPAEWHAYDNCGNSINIPTSEFDWLCVHFGNKTKETLWHMDQSSWGDGNAYNSVFKGEDAKLVVMTTSHSYTNKVAAAHAVRNYPEIKDKTGLFEYPHANSLHTPSILGGEFPTANAKLCRLNAKLGHDKQIRIWLLIYRDQPLEKAFEQEAYWYGGNKNELVICVGLSQNNVVRWAHTFSWTEAEYLISKTKQDALLQETFNPDVLIDQIETQVNQHWVRKRFTDYDNIAVPLPGWCILLVYLLVLLANGGFSWWAVRNDFYDKTNSWRPSGIGQ